MQKMPEKTKTVKCFTCNSVYLDYENVPYNVLECPDCFKRMLLIVYSLEANSHPTKIYKECCNFEQGMCKSTTEKCYILEEKGCSFIDDVVSQGVKYKEIRCPCGNYFIPDMPGRMHCLKCRPRKKRKKRRKKTKLK